MTRRLPVFRVAVVVWLFWFSWLGAGCHPRVPDPLPGARPLPERHFAPTSDGWKLALHHYPAWFRTAPGAQPEASSPGSRQRAPVILCHGIAANHYTFDLTEERSMARYLADRGYDVWILDLRGHGDSEWPDKRIEDRDGWGFDEYALRDVPAAIAYVRQRTGAPRISWVGHSMGGMVMYAYLASTGDPSVGGVVAIGSPGSLDFANSLVSIGLKSIPLAATLPRLYLGMMSRTMGRISGRLPWGLEETIWHLDNMAPEAARLMFWMGVENIERGVSLSFGAMNFRGKMVSRDLKTDYEAQLSRFKAPLLAIAGKLDGLAPPFTVQRLFTRVGSTDKTYELIGRVNGYSTDYGHVDLVLGDRARFDVYPLVYQWLEARAAEPASPSSAASAHTAGSSAPPVLASSPSSAGNSEPAGSIESPVLASSPSSVGKSEPAGSVESSVLATSPSSPGNAQSAGSIESPMLASSPSSPGNAQSAGSVVKPPAVVEPPIAP